MSDTKRISLLGVIVEDNTASDQINKILHAYSQFIVGRMGIPYHSRGVSIISVVLDATQETAAALAGELGAIDGVSCNIVSAKS
jgi:putative iron-only hydrogenase system regulator